MQYYILSNETNQLVDPNLINALITSSKAIRENERAKDQPPLLAEIRDDATEE